MTQDQFYDAVAEGAETLGLGPGDYTYIAASAVGGAVRCVFLDSDKNVVGEIEVPV